MKKNLQARLNMNYAVLLTLQVNAVIVNRIPALTILVEELKENVKEMEDGMILLSRDNKGIAEDKRNTRLELARQTAVYAGVLESFASDNKMAELKRRVKASLSKLERMGAGKLLSFSRLILEELGVHLQALDKYVVKEQDIKDLGENIDRMVVAIAKPQEAVNSRAGVVAKLKEAIANNRVLHKERIRTLLVQYRKTDMMFYFGYLKASKIRSAYTSHSRVQGLITDNTTGNEVGGVTVKAIGTEYTTVSSRNGTYKLFVPEKGLYTIVFEKEGYDEYQQKNVEIIVGEATMVNAVLATTEK